MHTDEIKARIEAAFPGARATVIDLTGTGDHFEAIIEAEAFRGMPLVARHQAVYRIFPDELRTERIHALKLTTKAPGEP